MVLGPVVIGPIRDNVAGGKRRVLSFGQHPTQFFTGRDGIYTFTRASTGSYVDKDGVLQTAVVDEQRFSYLFPIGRLYGGWLIEGQKDNIILQSETLDSATWTKVNATITADDTTAPDNATTMDSIDEDGTAAVAHGVTQAVTSKTNINTISCYAKDINRDFIYIEFVSSSFGTQRVWFDVKNGTVGAGTAGINARIRGPFADGSFRCIIFGFELAGGAATIGVFAADADNSLTFNGATQQSVHCWGLQCEEDYLSSYIGPTLGVAVTRSPDLPVLDMTQVYPKLDQGWHCRQSFEVDSFLALLAETFIFSNWQEAGVDEEYTLAKIAASTLATSVLDASGTARTYEWSAVGAGFSNKLTFYHDWQQGRALGWITGEDENSLPFLGLSGAGDDLWDEFPDEFLLSEPSAAFAQSLRWQGFEFSL